MESFEKTDVIQWNHFVSYNHNISNLRVTFFIVNMVCYMLYTLTWLWRHIRLNIILHIPCETSSTKYNSTMWASWGYILHFGNILTFGAWMSGGVDIAPKRSSCSTGWMSERNRNLLYLSNYYESAVVYITLSSKHNRAVILTWDVFTPPSTVNKASPPFWKQNWKNRRLKKRGVTAKKLFEENKCFQVLTSTTALPFSPCKQRKADFIFLI